MGVSVHDIIEARFLHEQTHGVRVLEVHVSPRLQHEIVKKSEVEHFILPASGALPRGAVAVAGMDWFVDHALTGEKYRFVS